MPLILHQYDSVRCLQAMSSLLIAVTKFCHFHQCRLICHLELSCGTPFLTHRHKAQSNLTLMNTLVWGTCNTNPGINQCIANMGWFAETLKTACADDLRDRNTLAVDTLMGEFQLSYSCQLERSTPNTHIYHCILSILIRKYGFIT